MLQKIRRFVTGHNAAGKAIVMIDDHAPNATEIKGWPGLGVTEVWVTDEMPVSNDGPKDRSLRPMRHDPTPSGTIFRVVEIPPESASTQDRPRRGFRPSRQHPQTERCGFRQAPDHAQDRLDRLSGGHLGLDAHAYGRRRSRAACRRLHRPARHQSCVGQPQRQTLPARSGPHRRQSPRPDPTATGALDEPRGLGREMGARRARPAGDCAWRRDLLDLSAMGGALARAGRQSARLVPAGRPGRYRHDQPAGIPRSAVCDLARRAGRGADERQAPQRGVRLHHRDIGSLAGSGEPRPRRRCRAARPHHRDRQRRVAASFIEATASTWRRAGPTISPGCSIPAAPPAARKARC